MRERSLLRYHGGKWFLSQWIIPLFPKHRIYCEPFGGGGSVLLRKPRSYAEVYNDLDSDIVNLFRVIRDRGEELQRALYYTPFSRDEFKLAQLHTDDELERARRTVVRAFMGFGSAAATRQDTGFRSNSNRSGTTPAKDWKTYPSAINSFIERLRGVVIENRDYKLVMNSNDTPKTLFYLDPPYVLETRYKKEKTKCYTFEMTEAEHEDLCKFILDMKGFVFLSGYDNELYNDILKGWTKESRKTFADGAKEREETIWVSPNTPINRQGLIFSNN